MSYCRQFDQFDPLTGAVPRIPFVALGEIAGRARRLLHDATTAQIIELAETVEWIIDKAIQTHGAGGLSQDFPLAEMFAGIRTLRFADGPDEVHKNALAKSELKKHLR